MQKPKSADASFALTTSPTPGSAKSDPILIADKIVRQFGGLTAVNVDHWKFKEVLSPHLSDLMVQERQHSLIY